MKKDTNSPIAWGVGGAKKAHQTKTWLKGEEKEILKMSFFQFSSFAQSCPTLCDPMHCSYPRLPCPSPWNLLKLLYIKAMTQSNYFILCHPLLLLLSIFPNIRVFPKESVLCIRWPKYWSFSFSISPSNEHSGLISFRVDWFDVHAVQGTLKCLLQHHSSKASVV